MGTGVSELTLAQLATLGKYNNVIFFNDPSDTDLLKTIVGSPRTILINLGQFLNIASGEIQGDALAADEIEAGQIAAGAIKGIELDATPGLFETATTVTQDHTDGAKTLLAANSAGQGDRLLLVQAEVTEAFVTTSWEIDIGSVSNTDGLFDDIFAGVAALGLGESLVGAYLLPEAEALVSAETSMVGDTAGIIQFSIIAITLNATVGNIADAAVTNAKVLDGTLADAKLASSIVKDVGALATGVLRVTGVTADGQTITIGSDIFEIDPIATDSGDDTAGGFWNNVTDPLTVDIVVGTYPNLQGVLIVGELIYIGTEYLRVTSIGGGAGDEVTFERGAGGSSAATHADAQNIFVSAATPAATNIPVGVQADFAAGTVGPILVATILEDAGTAGQANAVTAADVEGDGSVILLIAEAIGAVTLATTETHGNGAFDDTSMRRGAVAAVRQIYRTALVFDSEEVTANLAYIPLPFTPAAVFVQVVVTATGLQKDWDGDVIIVAPAAPVPAYVRINNDAAVDIAVTDTVYVLAIE